MWDFLKPRREVQRTSFNLPQRPPGLVEYNSEPVPLPDDASKTAEQPAQPGLPQPFATYHLHEPNLVSPAKPQDHKQELNRVSGGLAARLMSSGGFSASSFVLDGHGSSSLTEGGLTRKLSRLLSTTVNFRDVQLITSAEPLSPEEAANLSDTDIHGPVALTTLHTGIQKDKLIVILVGLPGRGKTFLCNKLERYLNWMGHETRHFMLKPAQESDPGALDEALDQLVAWLEQENSQCAIFDSTNSTEASRQYLRKRFHGRFKYLMVESVCNDQEVLFQNYQNKMRTSLDYSSMNPDQALQKYLQRVKKFEDTYETITDRTFHFIRLTNILTGRGHMDVNRISGYIPGKIVLFLMQVCNSGQCARKIWLTRHGQSEYNRAERLGGDSSISQDGERYAKLLPHCLFSRLAEGDRVNLAVWTSTLKRTIQTARHLPFPKLQWKALDEISAGVCDGMTYKEIEVEMPDEYIARKKDKLRYRYPEGESYLDLTQRLEPVIAEIERARDNVCIVSHQAVLRVMYGYFMGIPLDQIPSLEIPLHTLIELTPMPDGTMQVQHMKVNIDAGPEQFNKVVSDAEEFSPGSPDSAASCSSQLPVTEAAVLETATPALVVASATS